MEDVSTWKVTYNGEVLAQILKCIPGVESQKVMHKTLNGSVYVQQIGVGAKKAALTLFVESQQELMNVDECNAAGGRIAAYYAGTSYFGVIENEQISWEEQQPGNCYTGEVTMLVLKAVEGVLK